MKNEFHVPPGKVITAVMIVILAGFLSSWCEAAESVMGRMSTFRCGNDLVSLGDSVAEVLLCCGEPSYRHATGAKGKSRTVKRKAGKESQEDGKNGSFTPGKKRTVSKTEYEEKLAETWYYNRGVNDFVYSLHFDGGVLTKIVQGKRGK